MGNSTTPGITGLSEADLKRELNVFAKNTGNDSDYKEDITEDNNNFYVTTAPFYKNLGYNGYGILWWQTDFALVNIPFTIVKSDRSEFVTEPSIKILNSTGEDGTESVFIDMERSADGKTYTGTLRILKNSDYIIQIEDGRDYYGQITSVMNSGAENSTNPITIELIAKEVYTIKAKVNGYESEEGPFLQELTGSANVTLTVRNGDTVYDTVSNSAQDAELVVYYGEEVTALVTNKITGYQNHEETSYFIPTNIYEDGVDYKYIELKLIAEKVTVNINVYERINGNNTTTGVTNPTITCTITKPNGVSYTESSSSLEVIYGSNITASATAIHYRTIAGLSSKTINSVTSNTTIDLYLEPITYTVTVNVYERVNGSNTTTRVPNPSIYVNGTQYTNNPQTITVREGTNVTASTTATHYRTVSGLSSKTENNVTSDKTINLYLEPITYTVTVNVYEKDTTTNVPNPSLVINGTTYTSTPQTITVREGTNVTASATATHYRTISGQSSKTENNITSNKTINLYLEPITYTVTIKVNNSNINLTYFNIDYVKVTEGSTEIARYNNYGSQTINVKEGRNVEVKVSSKYSSANNENYYYYSTSGAENGSKTDTKSSNNVTSNRDINFTFSKITYTRTIYATGGLSGTFKKNSDLNVSVNMYGFNIPANFKGTGKTTVNINQTTTFNWATTIGKKAYTKTTFSGDSNGQTRSPSWSGTATRGYDATSVSATLNRTLDYPLLVKKVTVTGNTDILLEVSFSASNIWATISFIVNN